jgi:hypothetical protein
LALGFFIEKESMVVMVGSCSIHEAVTKTDRSPKPTILRRSDVNSRHKSVKEEPEFRIGGPRGGGFERAVDFSVITTTFQIRLVRFRSLCENTAALADFQVIHPSFTKSFQNPFKDDQQPSKSPVCVLDAELVAFSEASVTGLTNDPSVTHIPNGRPAAIINHAAQLISDCAAKGVEIGDTFYVTDLGATTKLYQHMARVMPRVTPHYAVKCFPEPMLLATLAEQGAGFDCASKRELDMVLSLGVSPDRVIFANPCKRNCDLASIAKNKVQT